MEDVKVIHETTHDFAVRTMAMQQLLIRLKERGCFNVRKKDDAIYNTALINLLLRNRCNVDKFLAGYSPMFKNHIRNNKNQLVSCEAYFNDNTK